ncbi:MAG: helical backbone metal receptor [Balneolaceae bacterium]
MAYHKIISLVPSLTELIIDLGLANRLIGRTRFCIHPADVVDEIAIIGGTKNPNIEKIKALQPDFILANKEENRQEDIEELQKDCYVHLTEIDTIEDALIAIIEIGTQLGAKEKAEDLVQQIQNTLSQKEDYKPLRTAYFIWKEPWMVAGSNTYIHEIMKEWNLENIFSNQSRYPEIDLSILKDDSPNLIILSSEPYPFKEKHIAEVQKFCPNSQIVLLDGEWFSWYGSRMVHSFNALNEWRKCV